MDVNKPKTLIEAAKFLADHTDAKIVAGGTDLLPRINQKLEKHETLCYLDDLPEMSGVRREKDGRVFVGASVRLYEIAEIEMLRKYTALLQAASKAASPQIRNQATMGGNILQENRCMYFNNQVPWSDVNRCLKWGGKQCFQYRNSKECVALFQSDIAPVLIAFDAVAVIYSLSYGEKEMPVKDLYLKEGAKNIDHDEILIGIRLPAVLEGECSAYVRKTIRGSFDFPLLCCAARFVIGKDMIIKEAKVVFGAAGVMPRVFEPAEDMFVGSSKKDLPAIAEKLKTAIPKHIAPFRDVHVNAGVRHDMAKDVFHKSIMLISLAPECKE